MKKSEKEFKILLVGNPNCGKTTLFNLLTKSGEAVGNRIGVTFEPKEEHLHFSHSFPAVIIDLPGIYSLQEESREEKSVTAFLKNAEYDCIFNIADATNLSGSLYLTLQLLSLGKPTMLLLNMMDEAEKEGIRIHKERLEKRLGIPIFLISAAKNQGVKEIFQHIDFSRPPCSRFVMRAGRSLHRTAQMITSECVEENTVQTPFADRIDRWLCRPYIGIPFFFLVIFSVFFLTFSGLGDFLTKILEILFAKIFELCYQAFVSWGASETLCRFLILGVFRGVASVLAFIPQTAILFLLLAILEDTGYMSRAAFVMDTTLRPLGLSGKAFMPLLIGFGCTVPAVMSTVTLEEKEKKSVIFSLPFIPCNARLPLLLMITASFFENNKAAIAFFVYLLGIGTTMFSALLQKKDASEPPPLILELPKYRMPNLINLSREVGQKLKDFLVRAGTVVFLSCLIVDFLGTFTPHLTVCASGDESILAFLGNLIAPIFSPLGFGDGRLIAALAAGFFAKEAIVSTVEILIPEGISSVLSYASAISYLTFGFLYAPCIATLSAIRKELGGKKTLIALLRCLIFAYLISFLLYTAIRLFGKIG